MCTKTSLLSGRKSTQKSVKGDWLNAEKNAKKREELAGTKKKKRKSRGNEMNRPNEKEKNERPKKEQKEKNKSVSWQR